MKRNLWLFTIVLLFCSLFLSAYIAVASDIGVIMPTENKPVQGKAKPYINQINAPSYFKGKVWLVIGDSISTPGLIAQKKYMDYIAEWLGLTVVNVATSGTGYSRPFKEDTAWLDAIDTYPENVDLITIMGGLNDSSTTLGAFGNTDTATFYGTLDAYYKKLIERYPTVPIGVITSTPRVTCWGERGQFVGHVNAVVTVAQNYSLPVLDLYRVSGLRPWNAENNQRFFSYQGQEEGDGIHLNDEGHLVIAYKIYDFIVQYMR